MRKRSRTILQPDIRERNNTLLIQADGRTEREQSCSYICRWWRCCLGFCGSGFASAPFNVRSCAVQLKPICPSLCSNLRRCSILEIDKGTSITKFQYHNTARRGGAVLYLDLATCTIDLICAGSTPGSDCTTRVRMLCSAADAGKDVRKRDIFIHHEPGWPRHNTGRTYDRLVFGWLQSHRRGMLCQDLPCDRIVVAMVSVLDILF